MKIAFYTPTLSVGGYEKVVINYANAFRARHEVIILCGKAEGDLRENITPGVAVVDFGVRARGCVAALTKWLKTNSVDLLYVPFSIYTCMAIAAKKLAGSSAIIYGAQHGFESSRWKFEDRILGCLVKRADVLTAVSNTVADYDAKRLNINRDRYRILDNPVIASTEPIVKAACSWINTANCPILVTCGRLAKDKHIEIPIKIVHEVLKTQKVKLLILGDGPERENLKKLVEELGIKNFVHFEGNVKNTLGYLCQCNALLQTSEIESFGNSVVEALYCSLPVITTDCGGPVDIIEKSKYGINIGPYNGERVVGKGVEAVLKLLRKEITFTGMQQKAQKYIAENLEAQFMEPYYECTKKD